MIEVKSSDFPGVTSMQKKEEEDISNKRTRRKQFILIQLIVTVVFFVPYAWVDLRSGSSLVLTTFFYIIESLIAVAWYADLLVPPKEE
jgi:hypothetical protein